MKVIDTTSYNYKDYEMFSAPVLAKAIFDAATSGNLSPKFCMTIATHQKLCRLESADGQAFMDSSNLSYNHINYLLMREVCFFKNMSSFNVNDDCIALCDVDKKELKTVKEDITFDLIKCNTIYVKSFGLPREIGIEKIYSSKSESVTLYL